MRLLTEKEIAELMREYGSQSAVNSLHVGRSHWEELSPVIAEAQAKMTLKEVGEWIQKHCQGYHRGPYNGEYGHFGIYRKELKWLSCGKIPEYPWKGQGELPK